MERKELINQLRNAKLDNGNPIQWVHLICEAADMLERDEARDCAGCAYPGAGLKDVWCPICARSHKDRYTPIQTPQTPPAQPTARKKEKKNLPPISMEVYRQFVFDCAAEMMSPNCNYEAIMTRLIDLSDWPIKES